MHMSTTAAIITGGASGLGEATARHFASQGAKVTLLDRDAERGAAVAAEIGGHFVQTDVTDEASVEAAITQAQAKMGALNVAVNCAGIALGIKTTGRDGAHPLSAFQKTIDINLTGSFNIARLAATAMAKNAPDTDGARGVIINTASVAAFDGQKGQVAYAASKGGIVGMTLPIARDLSSLGIRVNTIVPGLINTPLFNGLTPEFVESLSQSVLYPKRPGRPEEIAQLAAAIIDNDYINGECIRMDGGIRMQPR